MKPSRQSTWRNVVSTGDCGQGRFNLAESTVRSLRVSELLMLAREDGSLDDLLLDYGDPTGAPALRREIGTKCGVPSDTVLTVPGTMFGLYLLAAIACDEGGEAVVATPCFGLTRSALERAGMPIRTVRLRFDNDYEVDVARLSAAMRPETRIVCLADPQNPSGKRIPHETIVALLAAMARRAPRALLFLDETYREATHGGAPPASAAGLDPRLISAGSLSKAHGAPGLRIGWLTVPTATLRHRLVLAKEALVLSGSVLDEALAAILLRQAATVLDERRQALGVALATVLRWQTAMTAPVEMVRPDAGALCCLRLDPRRVDLVGVKRFWEALPREQVLLAPGPWFGEARRVFRLGFGHVSPMELAAALAALSRALNVVA